MVCFLTGRSKFNLLLGLILMGSYLWALGPAHAAQDYWQRKALPKHPQRIVSLSPATTEMLYALGAEARLAAVTQDCNYPAAALKKPKVGRFGNILLEKILQQRPDLIVVTADMGSRLEPLKALSIPVLALETRHVQDIVDNARLLGKLTQTDKRAAALTQQWQARLPKGVKKHPRAFYMVWHDPLMAASRQSFIGDLMERSGARNVVSDAKAPFLRYRQESLLKANPELLIMPKSLAKQLKLEQGIYAHLAAVKHKRVLVLEDDLISRPGPRSFAALQQIHQYIQAHF